MKGETFNGLTRLSIVLLRDNVCIKQDFEGQSQIATLSRKVTENCATRSRCNFFDPTKSHLFDNHLKKYKVEDRNEVERQKFECVFWSNYRQILDHNKKYDEGLISFKQGVNQFTHLTREEIYCDKRPLKLYEGLKRIETRRFRRHALSVPKSYDWRSTEGVVQPVQDQGTCGSCYVFAGIGALEGAMGVAFGSKVKLSEMEAFECTNGCNSGTPDMVYEYTKLLRGAAYAKDYPYDFVKQGMCLPYRNRVLNSIAHAWYHASYENIFVATPNGVFKSNEDAMKSILISNGPLSVGFRVYKSFETYSEGIYELFPNEEPDGNYYHAVLLVGYGSENGKDFWIMKNSYGEKFFKISQTFFILIF